METRPSYSEALQESRVVILRYQLRQAIKKEARTWAILIKLWLRAERLKGEES